MCFSLSQIHYHNLQQRKLKIQIGLKKPNLTMPYTQSPPFLTERVDHTSSLSGPHSCNLTHFLQHEGTKNAAPLPWKGCQSITGLFPADTMLLVSIYIICIWVKSDNVEQNFLYKETTQLCKRTTLRQTTNPLVLTDQLCGGKCNALTTAPRSLQSSRQPSSGVY